ncbi:5' nucleotidase, NT5C type, partial [Staphylococcus aureus]|uniref:5' nucleotidase, NT5C type n=1 Tax=Staphylococcus aureus TaxID=1280 RepID=UPI0011A6ED93
EHDALITEVFREPRFFTHLKLIPHPQQVLKKLTQHYHLYIPTPPIHVPTSFTHKYQSLLHFFPFLHPHHFLFSPTKNIVEPRYLIHHNPTHLQIFTPTPIIFTPLHNINHDPFQPLNTCKDLQHYFLHNIHK